MSKYHALWEHIAKTPGPTLTLTFEEVEAMGGASPWTTLSSHTKRSLPLTAGRWKKFR